MIVYSVHFITEDGLTLLSEHFQAQNGLPDDVLFGGFLTAFQNFLVEMTKTNSKIKSIEIEGLFYHIRLFGGVRVVLVSNKSRSLVIENLMEQLGYRFLKEYSEILMLNDQNVSLFTPFLEIIYEVLDSSIIDTSKSIHPTKTLHTSEIFNFPNQVQQTALALLALDGTGTITEIINESGKSYKKVKSDLEYLQKKGYIGMKREKRSIIYFCSI